MLLYSLENLRSKCWEENDVTNGGSATNQHDKTIHTDAKTARGWHAEFKSAEEVFIDSACFGIAGFLLLLFVFETCALHDWVVEL